MARILKNYHSVTLKPEDLDSRIDFSRIFGRTNPLHIEIGAGKATFLVNQAQANPDIDFLGIEWASKFYRYAVDRIGRWSLKNVKLIRTDAVEFVNKVLPDNCADCFHIYFPDPWPKKRHHKRRFISQTNLPQLLRCLKHAGTIRIATDHKGYFEQIETVLSAFDSSLEKTDFLPAAGTDSGEWVGTNFERKYLKEARPIYTIAVRKI